MIVIAHRLSTIRDADNIIVMTKGKLIEQGTHSELIELGGTYSRLVQVQDLGHNSVAESRDEEDNNKPAEDLDLVATNASVARSRTHEATPNIIDHNLFKGLYLIFKEQRSIWAISFLTFIACSAGGKFSQPLLCKIMDADGFCAGATYPALAVLFSKTMDAFQTADVKKGDFFALMFFVVALGNLVAYAFAGWFANILAQVIIFLSLYWRCHKLMPYSSTS